MNVLPVRHLTIHSPLSPAQVANRLSAVIRTPVAADRPYQGAASTTEFRVNRVAAPPHMALPDIHGLINFDGSQTLVELTIRLPVTPIIQTLVPLAAFFGILLFIGSGAAGRAQAGPGWILTTVAEALAILALGAVVMLVNFNLEAANSETFFRQLLKASPLAPEVAR